MMTLEERLRDENWRSPLMEEAADELKHLAMLLDSAEREVAAQAKEIEALRKVIGKLEGVVWKYADTCSDSHIERAIREAKGE